MGQSSQPHELGGGLKSRHVTMLSIAGVIGASLFVGSSVAIAEAGPAVLLAYLFAGLLVVMIMRMLAEMAVATPDTGSFSTYADKAIGRWAGYTIGWLYWWFWVLVIPLEANIAAMILHSWVPGIPIWLFSLVITLALTGSNLLSVKNYGEFEFWLALCKVIAILAFIFLGAVAISGFYPYAEVSGISRLWDSGGFMPNGFGAVLSAMLITMFSFMGAEIVTIAAAESDTPEKHIVRATNSVIWRISIFYLCSIFVVVALIPWNMPGLKAVGSYRSVLELLNIPHAKLIMDCVILLSVTSCLNSALYTASRMLYSLSRRGDAPAVMGKINRSKTPYVAVLLSTGAAFLTVVVNYYAPAKVFKFLIDSSGAIALLVYLVIAVSQLRMRKILRAEGSEIRLRMWLYPWLTWLVIGFITFVLVVMLFRPAQQLEVISTGLLAIGIICTVPIMARWKKLVLWQKTPVHNTRWSHTMTITSLDGYRWLKNDIIRGNFQPDEKLRMSLLTSRYALGVGPLREALSQLVAERLVTVVNQKGYRVASMSEQELLDIFDARANMEAMLVSLAIARGGDEWEADVLAKAHLLSKLEACDASEKMLDEWDLRHQAFHTAIVAGCGSHYLLQMRERLFDLAARYRFIWLRRTVLSVEMLEDKHDQHQTLTAAVLARDTARASELMRQHLLTPIPIIQQAMAGN